MENFIRRTLDKPEGDIFERDLAQITSLTIIGKQVVSTNLAEVPVTLGSYSSQWYSCSDGRESTEFGTVKTLEDLRHFTKLTQLEIDYQNNLDITWLSSQDAEFLIGQLRKLSFIACGLKEIGALKNFVHLKTLELDYNDIQDISAVARMSGLMTLSLNNNRAIASSVPLSSLTKVEHLSLSTMERVDMRIVSTISNLNSLNLVAVEEIDYAPLENMNLTYLEIDASQEDLEIIARMKSLTALRLHGDYVDISPLTRLSSVTSLDIVGQKCEDIAPILQMLQLYGRCNLAVIVEYPNITAVRGECKEDYQQLIRILPEEMVENDFA